MKTSLLKAAEQGLFLLCLLCLGHTGSAQFVNLTAEITIYNSSSQRERAVIINMVVGTNSWQMDGDFCSGCKTRYWFTGDRFLEHTVITEVPPHSEEPGLDEAELRRLVGQKTTHVHDSTDGNPIASRRSRTLTMPTFGPLAWMAFCSGPYLKREGREVFPPSDLWMQLTPLDHFFDKTVVFDDAFGLPKTMDLYTTNGQPIVQYRVTSSTNVAGWQFPLEFNVAQYRPPRSRNTPASLAAKNAWELEFTAKGKLISIGIGTKPEIPEDVLTAPPYPRGSNR